MLKIWGRNTSSNVQKVIWALAEMKLPGRAWLEFEVEGTENRSTIRQTAIFEPLGLAGLTYWYALYPLHQLVFSRMLRNIARAATAPPGVNPPQPEATENEAVS